MRNWLSKIFLSLAVIQPLYALANEADLAKRIGDIFERAQPNPVQPGEGMRRPVFAKDHGCLKGEFAVSQDLPRDLRVGVFSQRGYPAWIRFSNDGPPRKDSEKSARGMAIKLVGVAGKKLLNGEEDALTQDFIMQNFPVFFSDTAHDFLDFLEGRSNPTTDKILAEMDKMKLENPLAGQYWTPVPYRLGDRAMKYMAKPCSPPRAGEPTTSPNYLRENLARQIAESDACFDFYVQLDRNPEETPVDRATIPWKTPFVHAARLTIPKGQDINAPERLTRCETLSYNGWHSLPEHEPLGSINAARKIVYKRSADRRRSTNGVEIKEPSNMHE